MSQKLKLFLYLSVMLNIILIGFVSGQFFKDNSPQARREQRRNEVITALPQEKRALANKVFGELKTKHDSYDPKIDAAKDNVEKELTKDNFDKDAFKKALSDLNEITGKMKADAGDSIAQLAAELTPEERKVIVEQFKKDKGFKH